VRASIAFLNIHGYNLSCGASECPKKRGETIMATVHSYARFSDPVQALGDSERRQLERGADWAKRHGHTFSDLRLIDRGKSGFRGDKQAALKLFLQELGKRVHPGDILLVEAIDRLGRRGIRPTQDVVNKILNAGIDIAILSPVEKTYKASDQNDLGGSIELAAFAYQAWMYSQNLSHRIKAQRDNCKAQAYKGVKFKKNPPGWLLWNGKEYEIKPGAAKTVEYIYQAILDGKGERRIHKELTQRKIAPIAKQRRDSNGWNLTYLGKLLCDPAVCGIWQPKEGEPIKDFYPRVISDDLYNRVQALRASRKQARGPRTEFVNLFQGMVHNARDGHPMHLQVITTKRLHYRRLLSWGCIKRLEGANSMSLSLHHFEPAVLAFLTEIKESDLQPASENTNEVEAKRGELATIQTRLEKLQEALESGEQLETVAKAISNLEKRKKELQADIRKLQRDTAVSHSNPHHEAKLLLQLGELDHDKRLKLRAVLVSLIESIWILPIRFGRRVAGIIQINFRNGFVKAFVMSPHDMTPTMKQIKLDGAKVAYVAVGRSVGVVNSWDGVAPENDLRNYTHPTLGKWLRKELGQLPK
jgi:DNA invertase Pin-like site-specific DNA recombinase